MLFALLAQSTDPLGGWWKLIVDVGSFGLLAYVIIRVAPAFLKESREEREVRDKFGREREELFAKTINGLAETHRMALQNVGERFTQAVEQAYERFDKQRASDLASYERHIETLIGLLRGKARDP